MRDSGRRPEHIDIIHRKMSLKFLHSRHVRLREIDIDLEVG